MKNSFLILIAAVAGFLLIPEKADGHHGRASFETSEVTFTGTVTDFHFVNPHCVVEFEVKDEKGQVHKWEGQFGSASSIASRGWTAASLEAGDEITISGYRAKNGALTLWVSKIVLSNGQESNSAAQGISGSRGPMVVKVKDTPELFSAVQVRHTRPKRCALIERAGPVDAADKLKSLCNEVERRKLRLGNAAFLMIEVLREDVVHLMREQASQRTSVNMRALRTRHCSHGVCQERVDCAAIYPAKGKNMTVGDGAGGQSREIGHRHCSRARLRSSAGSPKINDH